MLNRFFITLLIFTCSLFAENMWKKHGHNYSYHSQSSPEEETVIFPVIWDVRSANDHVNKWRDIYGFSQFNPIHSILEESFESGFNTALVRSELTDFRVPANPGAPGDHYFPLADDVRSIGLNLMLGGLRTNLAEEEHNQAVVGYLEMYLEQTAGLYESDVIGCFSFDEPDAKAIVYPEQAAQWYDFVPYWNERCRSELNLPVMCYFTRYGTRNSVGQIEYFTDTTSVLNRMSRFTDAVAMDMYPVKKNCRRTTFLGCNMDNLLFTTATDIIQNDHLQMQALNSKDEVVRIFASGDSARIAIDDVVWDGIDLTLETVWESPLPFEPDAVESSDFRAGYAVQEAADYVNSGIVLWKNSLSVDEVLVVASEAGQPVFRELPEFPGSDLLSPVFFSVGQTDYWNDLQEVDGIIGHGRLAILAGLQDEGGNLFLMLYTASGGGSTEIETAFDEPVALHFAAETAVWGTFWGTWYRTGTALDVVTNGFLVADDSGNYVVLNQINRDTWELFPDDGTSSFTDLFGSSEMPDLIRISRIDSNTPPFFAGRDQLVGWFADEERIVALSGPSIGSPLNKLDSISIQGLPGKVNGFDLFLNDYRYYDSLLFTVEGGDVYTGTSSMDTGLLDGVICVDKLNYCSGDTVITTLRAMHTRNAYRSTLIPTSTGYYAPLCELYDDVFEHYRFQWFPEAHQVGMDVGVEQTSIDNSLFAVIQSYGRHAFALPSYCASVDTMLYEVTVPLVAGARGLVFYALDLSMMSGNGGDDGIERAPFLLQNWGPSSDIENADMIGVIHSAVASLTGNGENEGTDYLSALIDPGWRVLTEEEAFNRTEADTLLNFIALENGTSDTLLVIAVNQSTSQTPVCPGFYPGIVFNNLSTDYSIISSEGFTPELIYSVADSTLELDYSTMDGVSASLVTLSENGSENPEPNWSLRTVTSSCGVTSVYFYVSTEQVGELALYDLTGRKIETIWHDYGLGLLSVIDVTSENLSAGLYFIVLSGEQNILTGKCLLW